MTREQAIKEMAEKVDEYCCDAIKDCGKDMTCFQCIATKLYADGYRKVELDKLAICASEGENPYPEMFRYPWSLGYEAGKLDQLAHTKQELKQE